jgi:hypothetical protein
MVSPATEAVVGELATVVSVVADSSLPETLKIPAIPMMMVRTIAIRTPTLR